MLSERIVLVKREHDLARQNSAHFELLKWCELDSAPLHLFDEIAQPRLDIELRFVA